MLYFQQWEENSFENQFLKKVKNVLKDKPDQKIYLGFDYGFFCGMNIYYGSQKNEDLAQRAYQLFKSYHLPIRLITNISYDFDLILLFGYPNQRKERHILRKNEKKIMKALSFL